MVYSESHFQPLLQNAGHPLKVTPCPTTVSYASALEGVRNLDNKMHPWRCLHPELRFESLTDPKPLVKRGVQQHGYLVNKEKEGREFKDPSLSDSGQ